MKEGDAPRLPPPKRRRRWLSRLAKWTVSLALTLAVLTGLLAVVLDTGPGHRFIADRIAAMAPDSGLRIHIGRIDGSIFGKSQLRNVTVADQNGVFLTSPNIKL
ncbi:MAG TPA: hypothetical protein VF535_08290, partial [Allosphingosinicella sp.]